jgi:predicted DNA-binding transcriptional regulator AlpA
MPEQKNQLAPDPDDAFSFWRFADLVEMRIVTNRADLHNKQKDFGFPKPIRLGGGRGHHGAALFPRDAVKAWIRKRREAASRGDH